MATVSLTDLSGQQAEIDRRRKMAELLQQQAMQPIEIQSYKGTQAPIPWTAVLGEVLQNSLGAYEHARANKQERQLRAKARDEASQFLREQTVDPGISQNAGMIRPEDLSTKLSLSDRLKYGGGSSPQALGAVLGGQPLPQPSAPPPAAPQAPPQAMPAPMPGPVLQQPLPPAMDAPQAVSTTQPMTKADVLPSQAFNPQRERPMAEQQQRLIEAAISGNPYLEKLAPSLYERNVTREDDDRKFDRTYAYDQLKREQSLQDKLTYDQLKLEERTALQKDYGFAQSQGFKGGFMDFLNAYHPQLTNVAPGTTVFNTRDLAGAGGGGPSITGEQLPGAGGGGPSITGEQLPGAVTQMFPGARITSTQRTPAENAAVGGAPGSQHIAGSAVDFVLGSEAEMQAAADHINQTIPGARAIYEGPGAKNSTGPHVHVQLAQTGGAPGAPQPVAVGAPKQDYRPATVQEKAQYGISPEVPAQIGPNGQIQVVSGTGAANKRVPPAVQAGYIANGSSIKQIDDAIAAIRAYPKAMGLANVVGDEWRQRSDPDGVKVRAAVANIGAVKIHDLSGAAVTATETPRLKPFIPMPTDNPQAAISKLQQLREQLVNNNAQIETQYDEGSGYMPLKKPAAAAPPAGAGQRLSPQQAAQLPPGTRFVGLDGVARVRQ